MATETFRDLSPLLAPRAIAVVGASPRGNRGTRVLENLATFGYSGDVFVVNPGHAEVRGHPCLRSVDELPDHVDLVVVAVGAERVLEVVDQAGARGIRGLVIIGSGFGEGAKEEQRGADLAALIEKHDMVACGPNCYGVFDVAGSVAAYSGRIVQDVTAGNVALIMQSGALTHAVTDSAMGRGLGLSAIVTTGNELSATLSDYVAWYADDERTRVIGVFMEGLRDADKFVRACHRARERGKAVVVLASGRSETGKAAAMAHTGAISGSAAALDGLLATAGAIRVDDMDEFRETLLFFSAHVDGPSPTAAGLAAVSISGGACGLTADAAEAIGLDVPAFRPDVAERLAEQLPEFAGTHNPLDVTGAAAEDPDILASAIRTVAADPAVGVVAFIMNVGRASPGQEEFYRAQARILADAAGAVDTPVVLVALTSGELDATLAEIATAGGVSVGMGLRPSLKAVQAWLRWHTRPTPETVPSVPATPWPSRHDVLSGVEALDTLVAGEVPVARYRLATSAAQAAEAVGQLASTVVLKVESVDIAHKTEAGGVRLGVDADNALAEAERLLADVHAAAPDARIDGVLVQEMVAPGRLEVLLGVVRDPQVGLCMTIAPGGVLAELLGEAPSRPVPLSRRDVEELIDAGPLGTLLAGYRGGAVLDREALVAAALHFSRLAASLSGLGAAEVNPLLVGEVGQGAIAVDCLLIRESVGGSGPAAA